ncbi:hypothetical protein ACF0H5_020747 [Mactra antiquata]
MSTKCYVCWIYVVCMINTAQTRSAYCINEVTRDPGFQECLSNYTLGRERVLFTKQSTQTDPVVLLICSSETRVTVQCLTFFIHHCPDILNTTQLSEFKEIKSLQIFDDIDVHCRTKLGACHDVEQCISKITISPSSSYNLTPTPFSLMQEGVETLCGPLKQSINCFNNTRDQCKSYITENKKLWNNILPSFVTIVTSKSLDNNTLHFITSECQTIPADFSTNMCVKNSVLSDGFVGCYEKVLATYPPDNIDNRCTAYNAGYMCIAKFVGSRCGHEYTEAFAVISPLFISDVPKDCEPVKPLAVSAGDLVNEMSEPDAGKAVPDKERAKLTTRDMAENDTFCGFN